MHPLEDIMHQNTSHEIVPDRKGLFQGLLLRVKLVLRLIADRRVNLLLKVIPFGSFLYLLAPDLFIGPIDDAAVIWLGAYLFVELCPPDVVEEHMRALNIKIPAQNTASPSYEEEDIIEGEFREEA
jgi:hypothetical protein